MDVLIKYYREGNINMKNEILNNDIAFSSMLDAIEVMNEDKEDIAEVTR